MRSIVYTAIFLVAAAHCGEVVEVPETGSVAVLSKKAQETREKLKTAGASWTATHECGQFQLRVRVIRTPTKRKSTFTMIAGPQSQQIAELIESNGVWYATEAIGMAGKFRPYEAPFFHFAVYYGIERSALCYADSLPSIGTYRSRDGLAVIYHLATPEEYRRYYEQLSKVMAQREDPNLEAMMKETMANVERGMDLTIDTQTGIILQWGGQRSTVISDFRWRNDIDEKEFGIGDRKWDDFTDDPTTSDMNETLMINHGMEDGDAHLLNLRTHCLRRIPFIGMVSNSGAFSSDRGKVYVIGRGGFWGGMDLYEIDLKTGANRRIPSEILKASQLIDVFASPTEPKLAVIKKCMTAGFCDVEIVLVDVATGESKVVGSPVHSDHLCWARDGKSIYLGIRKPGKETLWEATIQELDLNGNMRRVCRGDSPELIGDGRTMLFQDWDRQGWRTADLHGGNVTKFADGLLGWARPSPSPDGTRIIMLKFRPRNRDDPFEPIIIDLKTMEMKPACGLPGSWEMPRWR